MKWQFALCCVAVLAMCIAVAPGDEPGGAALHNLLIPTELLMRHRAEIGLTDRQVADIRAHVERDGRRMQAAQNRANQAMGRLAELLSAAKVDEQAALKQLDEVLAIEKDQKRLHLQIMIRIRNELTGEQRRIAAKIRSRGESEAGIKQRLTAKLGRIETEVQSRSKAGRPPFDVVGLMQKFPELMQNGQVAEAEALLDRVTAMLGLDPAGGKTDKRMPQKLAAKIQQLQRLAQQRQQDGDDVSKIRELMRRLPAFIEQGKTDQAEALVDEALMENGHGAATEPKPGEESAIEADDANVRRPTKGGLRKPYTPEAVRAEFAALKKQDVAWRQIEWKTCLLDGLKASREQKKPILLWIFIDRPIDDERC